MPIKCMQKQSPCLPTTPTIWLSAPPRVLHAFFTLPTLPFAGNVWQEITSTKGVFYLDHNQQMTKIGICLFFSFQQKRFVISCRWTCSYAIGMKCQTIFFLEKGKTNISKCLLLKILPILLSVLVFNHYHLWANSLDCKLMIFFFFFFSPENRIWYFMQIVS